MYPCDTILTDKEREVNTMSQKREELLDRMIRIYGFEHECVLSFAHLMELDTFTDGALEAIVKAHEEYPMMAEEEE